MDNGFDFVKCIFGWIFPSFCGEKKPLGCSVGERLGVEKSQGGFKYSIGGGKKHCEESSLRRKYNFH